MPRKRYLAVKMPCIPPQHVCLIDESQQPAGHATSCARCTPHIFTSATTKTPAPGFGAWWYESCEAREDKELHLTQFEVIPIFLLLGRLSRLVRFEAIACNLSQAEDDPRC